MVRLFLNFFMIFALLLTGCSSRETGSTQNLGKEENPRIVNIINFIRQCEPRIDWITEDVLYETVVEQIEIMKKYEMKGTFLIQYDALIDTRYQELLKSLSPDQFEIGAWWEIPKPLVENSGYVWRGRYPWDWHADVGFSTGYSPGEREKLVDTYMADFKDIFGYYPESVGSWFIDAHSLRYMSEKYGIIASCNCKDQIGTDGYTLWGGYWNQGYFPSVNNAYMPAQNRENQISVPVFRMLGSDPIHQYDNGLGTIVQRVVSLEPVYKRGGGDSLWCEWYFREFINGASMEYAYVQTGQENSFTWQRMSDGFNIQMPLIDSLRDKGKIRVETLAETGKWFMAKYRVTPPTSVTIMNDYSDKDLKTVWFNSRYYRTNFLWENGKMRFRDIHVFNEKMKSDYLSQKGNSSKCDYYTLPVVDGFLWSSDSIIAGMRFKTLSNRSNIDLEGGQPVVDDSNKGKLNIKWPLINSCTYLNIFLDEKRILITMDGDEYKNWFLELSYDNSKEIPLTGIERNKIDYIFKGFGYSILLESGYFDRDSESCINIFPEENQIEIQLSQK